MAALIVITAAATSAFYHCFDSSRELRRNADEIVRVLHAGEKWRADLRAATAAPQPFQAGNNVQLTVPTAAGPIIYTFADARLTRQSTSPAVTSVLFTNIFSSQMQAAPDRHANAWVWEIELNPNHKNARVHPRFTFETVAGPAKSK
jgi:hypothetical protein